MDLWRRKLLRPEEKQGSERLRVGARSCVIRGRRWPQRCITDVCTAVHCAAMIVGGAQGRAQLGGVAAGLGIGRYVSNLWILPCKHVALANLGAHTLGAVPTPAGQSRDCHTGRGVDDVSPVEDGIRQWGEQDRA